MPTQRRTLFSSCCVHGRRVWKGRSVVLPARLRPGLPTFGLEVQAVWGCVRRGPSAECLAPPAFRPGCCLCSGTYAAVLGAGVRLVASHLVAGFLASSGVKYLLGVHKRGLSLLGGS